MSKRLALIAARGRLCAPRRRLRLERRLRATRRPTTEWANGLCSSITTWQSEITTIVDSLKGGNLSQDSLTAAVDDAEEATRNFTTSLKGLGRPDTEAGQQAQDSVNELTTQIDDDMTKIQDTVSNASGVAGVIAAVPTITTHDPVGRQPGRRHDLGLRGRSTPRASSRARSRTQTSCKTLTAGS